MRKRKKTTGIIIICVIAAAVIAGAALAIDKIQKNRAYKAEIEAIAQHIRENSALMAEDRKAYEKKAAEDKAAFEEAFSDLAGGDERIKQEVTDLSAVFIGDSVMLGAVPALKETFPNSYCDAAISRSAWVVRGILDEIDSKGKLGDPVVLNFGANGDCADSEKEKILERLKGKEVYWLTNTFAKTAFINDNIRALAEKHDNLTVLDWKEYSAGHSEYFYKDGLHLTPSGRTAYASFIYDSICEPRIEKWQAEKDQLISDNEERKKQTVAFYGNDLLTGCYDLIRGDFSEACFTASSNYSFDDLKADLAKAIENGTLAQHIVLVFGKPAGGADQPDAMQFENTDSQRAELQEMCEGHDLYVIPLPDAESLYRADNIHLSEEANLALAEKIKYT